MIRLHQRVRLHQLGIDRSTLHRWTIEDAKLHSCEFRRSHYPVQKLRDAKILTDGTASDSGLSAGLADDSTGLAESCASATSSGL